ncbi:MAG TPA: hypothetical protein VF166_02625 [Gemmatimonadaceae bacterium]
MIRLVMSLGSVRCRVLAVVCMAGVLPLAAPLAPARAQAPTDTARYVVLFSSRRAGYYNEWRVGRDLHAVFDYNDRGRGPHLEASLRADSGDVPVALTVVGHEYLKDTVDERFTIERDRAAWTNTIEHGSRAAGDHGFYLTATESPIEYALLVRAARRAGGKLPLLPSGEATVTSVGALTIDAGGTPVHLTQYDIGGLDFSPVPVWLDDSGERFAVVSSWSSIVPVAWERAVPRMIAAQDSAESARYLELARELGHRPAGALVIEHARLFVAESATVRPRTTVVITGQRITAMGPDGAVAIPAGAQIIDATGKTLLPGLWDMHVHIQPGAQGLLHIAAGVTSARDMGNDTVGVLALRRRFNTDSLIGPRLILAGLIDGSGPYQVPIGMVADDSASARRAVAWYAAHGYEQIKIYSSMKPALVPSIIADAHARGLRVSGHVPAFMTAEQVVRLGFNEVQHANFLLLNFMDSVKDTRTMARFTAIGAHGGELDFASLRVRRFVALFKARGVDIDPTLVAFEAMFDARRSAPRASCITTTSAARSRRGSSPMSCSWTATRRHRSATSGARRWW